MSKKKHEANDIEDLQQFIKLLNQLPDEDLRLVKLLCDELYQREHGRPYEPKE